MLHGRLKEHDWVVSNGLHRRWNHSQVGHFQVAVSLQFRVMAASCLVFFKLSNSNWWCWEILDQKKPQFYIISSRWRVSMASDWQLVAGWLHLVEFSSWFQLGTWIGVSFLTFTQVWLEIGLKIGGDFIWVLETGQNCVWSWAEIPNLTENWFRNWLKFYFHFGHNSKFNWRLVEILVKISFEFSNLPENWFRNWEEFHLKFGDWSELQLNSSFWIKFEIEMKIGWEIGDNIILVLETD